MNRPSTVVLLTWFFGLCTVATAAGQASANLQLIRDVRVFDGTRVLQHRSVLIEDGRIGRIGNARLAVPGAQTISGEGRTLMPGLIDAHVHIGRDVHAALQQALALGVTTQLDMYSSPDKLPAIKTAEKEDAPDVSDVRTAGMGATVPGGHPATGKGGGSLPTLTRPEEAQAFVDARIGEGSDYIKVVLDDFTEFHRHVPTLDEATLRAVVKAAHARGKMVIAHALMANYAKEAIDAGVDGLAHMYEGPNMDEDFGALAARHHIFVVPTLTVIYLDCGASPGIATAQDGRLSAYIREQWLAGLNAPLNPKLNSICDSTRAGIKQLVRARVPILAGTDSPVQGITYGASLHEELSLLVGAGLSPVQALVAATSAPAKAFHLDDRGAIAPGLRADMVLVQGDPTREIEATRNIVEIWKKGVAVTRTRPD
jgi:imidazolonepropionase-like amidohydrolase